MQNPRLYKRLAAKITLPLMAWLVGFTLIATVASFFQTSSIIEKIELANLENYIKLRGERESELYVYAEGTLRFLNQRYLLNLEEKQSARRKFHSFIERSVDGAFREKSSIDNRTHPSVFVPEKVTLTNEYKRTIELNYEFLDRECANLIVSPGDCWIGDSDGGFSILLPSDVGYSDLLDAKFDNLAQEWMKIAMPEQNPERLARWTKVYTDTYLDKPFVTVAAPVYRNNEFLGVIGTDIEIQAVVDRASISRLDGTRNMIFSEDGDLVSHASFSELLKKSTGGVKISALASQDPEMAQALKVAKNLLSFENSADRQIVIDSGADSFLAITKLDGPKWYFVTVYPKGLIRAAAFSSNRYIVIFGLLSLVLEFLLLMALINRRLEQPLNFLVSGFDRVSSGDLKTKIVLSTGDELERLSESFNRMTENLSDSTVKLEIALEQANESTKSKSEFVAAMSHEMRTPLNGILGMAHFLSGTTLSEEQRLYATSIESSGEALLAIINQVLDVAKIEAKKYEVANEPFTLREVVDQVRASTEFLASSKELKFETDIRISAERYLGDRQRILQMLTNLVGNAIKFSERGRVRITVAESKQDEATSSLKFSVSDNGIGISAEVMEKLFKPFSQADQSNSRKFGGTGLGLYLVSGFAALMKGDVGATSEPGVGSEFWFTLPLKHAPEAAPEAATGKRPQASLPVDFTGVRPVLLVEDNSMNLVVAQTMLKKMGLTFETATNGQEAIDRFAVGKFSLILMDCHMPVLDGYDAAAAIAKLDSSSDPTPIVALTANTLERDMERCRSVGMVDVVTKPFTADKFKRTVSKWAA